MQNRLWQCSTQQTWSKMLWLQRKHEAWHFSVPFKMLCALEEDWFIFKACGALFWTWRGTPFEWGHFTWPCRNAITISIDINEETNMAISFCSSSQSYFPMLFLYQCGLLLFHVLNPQSCTLYIFFSHNFLHLRLSEQTQNWVRYAP
jgi:hypothetical protein